MRYDRVEIRATRTDEGFIEDSPVFTRTGVFEYRNPNGTVRREYRPESAVFAADSLAAFRGIPITDGHPGKVTSRNARSVTVGAVLSEARRDADNVIGDIRIYDPEPIEQGRKELSVGYMVTLDETPGTAPNGERYDAIQTSIRPNHLALVARGRAGNARLNLDAAEEVADDETNGGHQMPENLQNVRLDSGLSYQAAPEVAQYIETLRQDVKALTDAKDKAEARADTAEKKLDKLEGEQDQIRQDAIAAARKRLDLEARADAMHISFGEEVSDLALQKAIIAKIMGDDIKLDERSDAYIEAAYDMAIAESGKRQKATADTRQRMTQDSNQPANPGGKSSRDARAAMIAAQQKG